MKRLWVIVSLISISKGQILIDGTKLNYVVEGNGRPCIVIGSSIYYPRTFSDKLRKHFQFSFVDMRWFAEEYSPVNLDDFTLQTISDDIERVRSELKLENVIIMGHSIHGTIALEYAKRYPKNISHIILIGSPNLYGSEESELAVSDLWNTASKERKELQEEKWNEVKDTLNQVTPDKSLILSYVANGPRYWYDANYDASWLWKDMPINMDLINHVFGTLFSGYDMFESEEEISLPIFVALGKYDYVVPYTSWEPKYENLPNLTISLFKNSGHTPQLEESARFDEKLLEWINNK
mgnify:CR=1 FL=1